MFREMLVKTIRSNPTAALQSERIREAVASLKVDDTAWESLTGPQRETRKVNMFASSANGLSEVECARLLSKEPLVSPKVVEIVSLLASLDKANALNPNRLPLLDTVARAVREERPLKMFASLCLEKGPGLRDGKLDWFLNGKRGETPGTLATNASIKGLGKVRQILDKVDYPVKATILLGDLDYAIVDGCRFWCRPGWEETLQRDPDLILVKTQQFATAFFGPDKGGKVQKWSSLYSANEVEAQLPRAETLVTPTESPAIISAEHRCASSHSSKTPTQSRTS